MKILAIQCFVKYDTLKIVLENLLRCYNKEKYTVVFGLDSCQNMPYQNRSSWLENNKKILELITNYKKQKYHKDTIILKNEKNLGCYQTCYKLINYAMDLSEFVIFIEDDVLLGRDSLIFYEKAFDIFSNDEKLFAVSSSAVSIHEKKEKNLFKLQKCNWVPSFQFGLCKKVWQKYGKNRGNGPQGDIDFGFDCRNNDMYTLCPKISRSLRIGINHPDSYTGYYHNNIDLNYNINNNYEIDSDNFDFNYCNYNLEIE